MELFKTRIIIIVLTFSSMLITAQKESQDIKSLDFLIGTWEVREENKEKQYWEETIRVASYTLDGNYIKIDHKAIDSKGRKRHILWFINYNKKTERYEMISMFGNWYKTQFDILTWNKKERKLTFKNHPSCEGEYHNRVGEMVFNKNFNEYVWIGENRYKEESNIWKYHEVGKKRL